MVMSAKVLRRYIEPLLEPRFESLSSIRIGTKALAYWPYRFVTDSDADDVLRLFEEVVESGRQLAFMAHFSHPRELDTRVSQQALRRIRSTGANVRSQAPVIRHVNDDPEMWATMWRSQVRLGVVPYYMFMQRDTGPKRYFEVPLSRALRIFNEAYSAVSGLARTVRGPSMSATPGKVLVDGVVSIEGQRYFSLKFIQARDPEWTNRVFFGRFDSQASWLSDIEPAFGDLEFFFEPYMRAMRDGSWQPEWKVLADSDAAEIMCEGA
jgi:L-lysine 2,3-aminomutase